jgi:hypothetical protein
MSLLVAISFGVFGAPVAASAGTVGNARVAGSSVNVRQGPSTTHPVVRKVRQHARLDVRCQVIGQTISGAVRRTAAWDRLADGRYISDAYVSWPGGPPAVGTCVVGGHASVATTVNVRGNASRLRKPIGQLRAGQSVAVACQLAGEPVRGPSGTSLLWDQVGTGRFVADALVRWPDGRPEVPWCSFSASTPDSGAPFVTWAAPYASQMKAAYQVPSSVTIAQAILESGWGRSGLTQDGNSFFGMKCFDSPGSNASGCRPYATSECAGSACYATRADFRVYDSVLASFEDHSKSIASLPRYRGAFAYAHDPDRFAQSIADAGYATSPTYARDLIGLMRSYDLYRYDRTG